MVHWTFRAPLIRTNFYLFLTLFQSWININCDALKPLAKPADQINVRRPGFFAGAQEILYYQKTHFIHNFCIILGQNHVHWVHQSGILQSVWVLAVLLFTDYLHGFLVFLSLQGAQREPSNPLHEVNIVSFVLILQKRESSGIRRNQSCQEPWVGIQYSLSSPLVFNQ